MYLPEFLYDLVLGIPFPKGSLGLFAYGAFVAQPDMVLRCLMKDTVFRTDDGYFCLVISVVHQGIVELIPMNGSAPGDELFGG